MARITSKTWNKYIRLLKRLSDRAAKEMLSFSTNYETAYKAGLITLEEYEDALVDFAYALATRYGEGAGAAACEMYDTIAELQGVSVPPAIPAVTATMPETAKTVVGAMKTGNLDVVSGAVGRLVKQAGADTTLQNAKRDGAYFAWVSRGDTCAYCLTLSALGWQKAGELTLEGGHAEHIHANCDCEYVVDFKGDLEVQGYDPDELNAEIIGMTEGEWSADDIITMSGHNSKGHEHGPLNEIRRKFYAKNKDEINAQKRSAYAKRMERESSEAEEINVD